MKTMNILGLLGLASLLAIAACSNGSTSTLNGGKNTSPNDTAGGNSTTFNHNNDPSGAATTSNFQPADPGQIQATGSPEVTARLHSCGKLSVNSIGTILNSRGMTGGGQRPDNTQSGMDIYNADDTPAALGGANYDGRVPEAPFASTSAVSKLFDIFAMGSYDLTDPNWNPTACPGVTLLGADGKFTKDGIACLIGKPATDDYVAIANQALVDNPTDGAKIAVASLLAAAHTCQ